MAKPQLISWERDWFRMEDGTVEMPDNVWTTLGLAKQPDRAWSIKKVVRGSVNKTGLD